MTYRIPGVSWIPIGRGHNNSRPGMRQYEFRGECVSWDYWACDECGLISASKTQCECQRSRTRADRRARRLMERAKQGHGHDELVSWLQVIERDPCSYCGRDFEHVDHVVALRKGGATDHTNLVSACAPCNRSKSDRPLLGWMLDREAS